MKLFGFNVSRARGRKEDPAWRSIVAMVYGQGAVWTPADYAALARAGYKMNAPAFACVSLIARAAAGISWVVTKRGRGGEPEEVEGHPLETLLKKPNEYDHGFQFIEKVVSFKLLAGNSYVLRQGIGASAPRFLYAMRPDRVKVIPASPGSGMLVAGYVYEVNGIRTEYKVEEVLHLKDFNPLDDFYGLSRMEVAAKAIDTSNASSEWNAKLLQNDMRPPGALVLAGNLTDDQREFLRRDLKEKYQGSQNVGMPLILEGGFDWKQIAVSPKDTDWLNADKMNLRRICSVFNVPSELLGDSENKTYSNVQEARRALYMETVLPILDNLRDGLNGWIAPLYGEGIELDYDRDSIEALQEDRAAKYAYLQSAKFITVNEKREATGYDAVGPEGDVILVSMGETPLEDAAAPPAPIPDTLKPFTTGKPDEDHPDPNATPEDGDGEGKPDEADVGEAKSASLPAAAKSVMRSGYWGKDGRDEKLWTTFEQRIKAREKTFAEVARAYLARQAATASSRAGAASSLAAISPADLLNIDAETRKYVKAFWPWYRAHFIRAGNAGVRATKGTLFDDLEFKDDEPTSWVFNITPAQEAALRNMVFNSGTKVNRTTIEKIHTQLRRAQEENLPVYKFAQDLHDEIGGELSRGRVQNWARTESTKVDNYGQLEGYKTMEVSRKGWMCAFVPSSRDAHIDADGQEVAIDDDFTVGGERMGFPGDHRGSPGNVCNCLCDIYPVTGEEE